MAKKEYVAPEIKIYGDVKELTQGGGSDLSSPDDTYFVDGQAYTTYDPVS